MKKKKKIKKKNLKWVCKSLKKKSAKAKYKSSGSIRDIPLWERILRASISVGV